MMFPVDDHCRNIGNTPHSVVTDFEPNDKLLNSTILKECADYKRNVAQKMTSVFSRLEKHCKKRRKC